MTELIFIVEEDPEGGYFAHAAGVDIVTQADTIEELREMVRDAVDCYFDETMERPKILRLHFVKDEVLAVS